jgi:glutamate/tyrosine decarboxylase-like PLP-dependent enzyme
MSLPVLVLTQTFIRNFSKPAAPVFAQMFNFLNLGFEGYKKIATKDLRNARLLSRALERTYFTVCVDLHVLETIVFYSSNYFRNRFLAMYIVQSPLSRITRMTSTIQSTMKLVFPLLPSGKFATDIGKVPV